MNNFWNCFVIAAAAGLLLAGCGGATAPLATVPGVDISRYTGTWFEVARLPNSFQDECNCSSAEYEVIDSVTLSVYNRCIKQKDGTSDGVRGKAFVVPNSNNAKLKVQFFWPFKGDYWIIALDEQQYLYAMVGTPSRKYLWILSRTPRLDKKVLDTLIQKAFKAGFDTSGLIFSENCK